MERIITPGAVAAVTGASSGIGREIALELARQGLHVYALARSLPDYFEDASHQQNLASGYFRPVRLDVNDEAGFRDSISRIIAAEGRLDCLVQAAGFGIAGAVEDTSTQEATDQFGTNFFGAIHALPDVIRQMRKQKRGLIVQIGSAAGSLPIPFQAYYSASKAALAALTLALASEVQPLGIRCMVAQPGDTHTGFTQARMITECAFEPGSAYADRCRRSIDKMAADETGGLPAESVALKIVRRMRRRSPPLVYTPGLFYKFVSFLQRLLPLRLVRWVIGLMYAS